MKLAQPYIIFGITNNIEGLTADLKKVAPQFVSNNENKENFLVISSHSWFLLWCGFIELEHAVYDDSENLITPPVFTDKPHFNLYPLTEEAVNKFIELKQLGSFENLENGTKIIEPPKTPKFVLA